MKKLLIVLLLVFAIFPTGCGEGNSSKITYYKEFNYIPKIPDSQLIKFTPAEGEKLASAEYQLPDMELATISKDYQTLLEKDGWTIKPDKDNLFLDCKKGTHTAAMLFSMKDQKKVLEIVSK